MSSSDLSTAAPMAASTGSRCAAEAAGLAVVTSIRVRISVSGVRSSWEAFAMNRRWLANAASSRASIASKVSASSLSSSGGPASASRWSRFSWEAACAAVVTAASGRSTRRLTAQPSPPASNGAQAQPG